MSNDVVALYPVILNFTYEVINSLKGKKETDERKFIGEALATKIFLHATTIQYLRNGSNVTLKAYPDGSHVVDFASIFVLTRAILETYITLFEIFFDPSNDDEFEYRYSVYQLRGMKIVELTHQNNPSAEGQNIDFILKVQQGFKNIENLKNRVKRTAYYKKLDANQQAASLEGSICPKRNRENLAKDAGLGKKTFQHLYAYLSAYAHGDSLSIAQIKDATSPEMKDNYIQTSMTIVMMILSHLILNYARKFPEAQAMCDSQPANKNIVTILAKQASLMK